VSTELNPAQDLTDPKVLTQNLDMLAEGCAQQILVANSVLPIGGHSDPKYFYAKIQATLQAASRMIKEHLMTTAEQQAKKEVKK